MYPIYKFWSALGGKIPIKKDIWYTSYSKAQLILILLCFVPRNVASYKVFTS